VTLELVSDGDSVANSSQPIDSMLEYRKARSFLISSNEMEAVVVRSPNNAPERPELRSQSGAELVSSLKVEFDEQVRVNAPKWTKWDGKVIETAIGDIRQWGNETVISYSIFNNSDRPTEIVPPQIQITGRKLRKKGRRKARESFQTSSRFGTTG
jgi:hypothetical protein